MTPTKLTKVPVTIEGMRWDGTAAGAAPIVEWVRANGGTARWASSAEVRHELPAADDVTPSPGGLFIDTLEGSMLTPIGGWVLRGVAGEFYPCAADILDRTYVVGDPDDLPESWEDEHGIGFTGRIVDDPLSDDERDTITSGALVIAAVSIVVAVIAVARNRK